jgi:hypothetical protein
VLDDFSLGIAHIHGMNIRAGSSGHAGRGDYHRGFMPTSLKIEIFQMIDCDLVKTVALGIFIDDVLDFSLGNLIPVRLPEGRRGEPQQCRDA